MAKIEILPNDEETYDPPLKATIRGVTPSGTGAVARLDISIDDIENVVINPSTDGRTFYQNRGDGHLQPNTTVLIKRMRRGKEGGAHVALELASK